MSKSVGTRFQFCGELSLFNATRPWNEQNRRSSESRQKPLSISLVQNIPLWVIHHRDHRVDPLFPSPHTTRRHHTSPDLLTTKCHPCWQTRRATHYGIVISNLWNEIDPSYWCGFVVPRVLALCGWSTSLLVKVASERVHWKEPPWDDSTSKLLLFYHY